MKPSNLGGARGWDVSEMSRHVVHLSPDVEALLSDHVPDDTWNATKDALGKPPRTTFLRVNTSIQTREVAKKRLQAFVTEQCERKKWPPYLVKNHPTLHDVLYLNVDGPLDVHPVGRGGERERRSFYWHLEGVKFSFEIEVIVDAMCGNAVMRGADIFAAGILAAESPMEAGDTVSVYVDLDQSCLRGTAKRYEGGKLFLGNGVALMGRDVLYTVSPQELKGKGVGILMTCPIYRSPSLSDMFGEGLALQNLPSILVAHVLDPQPGEMVLDMCAAPGGKTFHIATLMNDTGTLIALDRSSQKIARLATQMAFQNLTSTRAYACDATSCVMSEEETAAYRTTAQSGEWRWPPSGSKMKQLPRESFDRILLDGPCSAMGQRPNFRPAISSAILIHHAQYQRSLLHAAHRLLRPGGRLVYSTCTIAVSENEANVGYALEQFPDLEILDVAERVGGKVGRDGLKGVAGLSEEARARCWRFQPGEDCGIGVDGEGLESIGFFFAVFRKRG
ncbi:putative methyltransferase nsun6 [Borealophlyctis nickersoniae]|nr:putative methyltransferase nsun6 [Borealophlyctis nickersoniae]